MIDNSNLLGVPSASDFFAYYCRHVLTFFFFFDYLLFLCNTPSASHRTSGTDRFKELPVLRPPVRVRTRKRARFFVLGRPTALPADGTPTRPSSACASREEALTPRVPTLTTGRSTEPHELDRAGSRRGARRTDVTRARHAAFDIMLS